LEEGASPSQGNGNVLDSVLLAAILEQVQVKIDASLSKQTAELGIKIEQKNDELLSKLAGVKQELSEGIEANTKKVDSISRLVESNKQQLEANTKCIDQLMKDRMSNRMWFNNKEQRLRGASIRIHHYETKEVGLRVLVAVYRDFIQPAFSLAVKAGELDRVPSLFESLEFGHRLRKQANRPGPPSIIVRFRSRLFKSIFMQFKKDPVIKFNYKMNPPARGATTGSPRGTPTGSPRGTPPGTPPGTPRGTPPPSPGIDDVQQVAEALSYAEAAAKPAATGLTVRIGDDLTGFNRYLMTWLYSQPAVSGARLSGDGIQYALVADPKDWLTVANPFASNMSELQVDIGPAVPPVSRQPASGPPPRRAATRAVVSPGNPLA
jgi:hypothetical protein